MKQKFAGKGDLAIRPESVGLTWPRAPREESVCDGVAVIRICGPLEHHAGWYFDSYESIIGRIQGAMHDEDVHSVLLDIDSPGGEVSGLQETVRKIRAMRMHHDKPVIAYANDEAYSAAYALACSADEIYLPEGGGVGSIGVLATTLDRTEATKAAGLRIEVIRSGTRKAEGHPDIPMTDSTLSHIQSRVDGLAKQFFRLVKEARPIKLKEIEALQGKCVYGQKAVNAGLADGIASFDEVLASMSEDDGLGEGNGLRGAQESVTVGEVMSYAVLQKKVASALAALTAAKNPASRKRCASAYAAAVSALTEAKVKKTYEKKTTETETEEDDGEAEKSELEDEESASDDDDGDDDDDDDDGSDAKQKAAKKASARADKKVGSLESFVRSLTGQSNTASAQQVLASMHEQALQNEANTQEIARLKADAARTKLNAMVSEGVAAGKIKPAQLAWAKTQTVASLKSYLEATPAIFQPRAPQNLEAPSGSADTGAVGPDGVTDFERALCAEQGVKVEAYVKQRDGKSAAAPKVN